MQAPAELVAVGRLQNAAELADTVLAWSGFPLNWRGLLDSQGFGLYPVLDLSAPIEAAMMLDPGDEAPNILMVASAGVRSLDEAVSHLREGGLELVEQSPGVYRLDRAGGPPCALSVAAGPAPARLVCGEEEAIEHLLPFATRGLPTMPLAEAEWQLRLFAEPWRERFGADLKRARAAVVPWVLREYALDSPAFDRALVSVLDGAVEEGIRIFEDARYLAIEGHVDREAMTMRLHTAFALTPSDSTLARTISELAARVTAPPAEFWGLSANTTSAAWMDAGGTSFATELGEAATALLRGLLEHVGARRETLDGVPVVVDLLFGDSRPGLTLTGSAPATKEDPLPNWSAYGLQRPLKEVEAALDAAVAIAREPGLKQLVAGWAVQSRKSTRAVKGVKGRSAAYDITLPSYTSLAGTDTSGAQDGDQTLRLVLLCHEHEGRTWVVVADQLDMAEDVLRDSIVNSGATLQSQTGLEALRGAKGVVIGAMAIQGVLQPLAEQGLVSEAAVEVVGSEPVWIPYTFSATSTSESLELTADAYLRAELFATVTKVVAAAMGLAR